MNWRRVGGFLVAVGVVVALTGLWWQDRIHEQRHACRLDRLFAGGSGSCPSKVPAFVLAGVGVAGVVVGLAMLVGTTDRSSHDGRSRTGGL